MEYSIVDLEQRDLPALDSIKPDTWSSVEEIHAHYLTTPSARCVKAVSDSGELLGIGTALVFGATGWLAHIIVSGAHQKRGLGTAIVQNRIRAIRETPGCASVTLTATDQGYPLYQKLGFKDQSLYRIMVRPQDAPLPRADDSHIRACGADHVEQVLAIDREVSGEDRKEFLLPILHTARVYERGGRVFGFYLPDFGDGGVYATTEQAGCALLTERVREDKPVFIPEENEDAYRYLASLGYTEVKRIHRMILGPEFRRNPLHCYARIGGFAG